MMFNIRACLSAVLLASVACAYGVAAVAAPQAPPRAVLPNAADPKPASETSRTDMAVVGLGKRAQPARSAQVAASPSSQPAHGDGRPLPMAPPPKH